MKTSRIIAIGALIGLVSFASCKKTYTCTCTTVVGTESVTEMHTIDNYNYVDAKKVCYNYQNQSNNVNPGHTTCGL